MSQLIRANYNKGMKFDKTDDYIDAGSRSSLDDVSTFTTFSYFRMDSAPAGGTWSDIISKYVSQGCIPQEVADGRQVLMYWNSTGTAMLVITSTLITLGRWTGIVTTYDNAGDRKGRVYFDPQGAESGYSTQNAMTGTFATNAANNLQIGRGVGAARYFDGIIAEIAMWNVVLSTSDIATLLSSKIRGKALEIKPSNLKLYLPLDDIEVGNHGGNRTFYDLSGNLNHATGNRGTSGLTCVNFLGGTSNIPYRGVSPLYLEKKAPYQVVRYKSNNFSNLSAGTDVTVSPSALSITASVQTARCMVWAPIFYNRFKTNLLKGLFDVNASGSHIIKVALLADTYTFNPDHNYFTTVSLHEVSGTNYTAGGTTLTNFSVTQDNSEDWGRFDADDATWSTSTITARYAVAYDNTLTTKDLIFCIDFQQNKVTVGGTFSIVWNSVGLMASA